MSESNIVSLSTLAVSLESSKIGSEFCLTNIGAESTTTLDFDFFSFFCVFNIFCSIRIRVLLTLALLTSADCEQTMESSESDLIELKITVQSENCKF